MVGSASHLQVLSTPEEAALSLKQHKRWRELRLLLLNPFLVAGPAADHVDAMAADRHADRFRPGRAAENCALGLVPRL